VLEDVFAGPFAFVVFESSPGDGFLGFCPRNDLGLKSHGLTSRMFCRAWPAARPRTHSRARRRRGRTKIRMRTGQPLCPLRGMLNPSRVGTSLIHAVRRGVHERRGLSTAQHRRRTINPQVVSTPGQAAQVDVISTKVVLPRRARILVARRKSGAARQDGLRKIHTNSRRFAPAWTCN